PSQHKNQPTTSAIDADAAHLRSPPEQIADSGGRTRFVDKGECTMPSRTGTPPPRRGGPLPPGPPNFSEIEGGPHHPGAAAPPGAGPNPTPTPEPRRKRDEETTPAAANVPGAGPNPTAPD